MKNIKLYILGIGNNLKCCCPSQNKCNKAHGCELMKFTYGEYKDLNT